MAQKSGDRTLRIRKKKIILILWGCCFLSIPICVMKSEASEWKLKTILKSQEEENSEHHGIGLSLKFTGGWNIFSDGDIDKGTKGLFEQNAEAISSLGYEVAEKKILPFHSGYDLAGEIVYNLKTRMGIGLRVGYMQAKPQSTLRYYRLDYLPYLMWSLPNLSAVSCRLGLHYAFPIHQVLTICLKGGPELHFVNYKYTLSSTTLESMDEINQNTNAKGLGFNGSIELEFSINPIVAMLLEVQGRYAKINSFQGKETLYQWRNFQSSVSEKNGFLYYLDGEEYPKLQILPEESSGNKNARKAVFDFTGVSFVGGLKFRF